MGYYNCILSTSSECVPLSDLESALRNERLRASLSRSETKGDDWTELVLSHEDGVEIAVIERNPVERNSLGADELAEFADEMADGKPSSAAKRLVQYFERVRCIYALQLLTGTDHRNGWDILSAVKNCIWAFGPSIFQADGEGFSNEDGYHILWQFRDSVTGDWWMGILENGQWKHFQMNLGDRNQRDAFLAGRVPVGVTFA